jgi:hypothetical protein
MYQQVAYMINEKQPELTFKKLGSGSIFSFISKFSLISYILSSDYGFIYLLNSIELCHSAILKIDK